MSGYNPDYDPENEWDDKGNLIWNEHDWRRYLNQQEQEIVRFLSLYYKMNQHPNKLDEIAQQMGWDKDDWSAGDLIGSEQEEDPTSSPEILGMFEEEHAESEEMEPYTVHRHPVYIITRGLYRSIRKSWSSIARSEDIPLSNALVYDLSSSLREGEHQSMMAIQAIDVGDFGLSITHFKSGLAALNETLGLMSQLPLKQSRQAAMFHTNAMPTLFDLRELWLKVMNECREENLRGFGNQDN